MDAYRGAGRPESNYLLERLVDAAARELKHRPRGTAPAQHGAALGDAARHARRQDLRQRRLPDGAGCGTAARWTTPASPHGARTPQSAASAAASASPTISRSPMGDPTERAEIRFAEDGFVDVYVGTQSTGQGHETAYIQLTVAASSASTARRSASARAIPTPSRSAVAPAARAACIPKARRSC